ncbi:hypothetical protein STSP2_01573 [Anaerohalosphaera lusitana]|uniref:Uncharacterized protein n=1 Tax=Anaerohalosphaera lusitana TaxID=1936003 RepID=A0A1U9NKF7_9BACT|nr:hypothetical protein [Anaerohalosphaera lusitana]AQT68413.1 hypothetical protein STSP2_01573 [Anaerohalosphaera lusitana]
MNLKPAIQDNVTDILVKIIEFTRRRDEVLRHNVLAVNDESFEPRDLDVDGFADLMAFAMSEHVSNNRLVFSDNQTIRFCGGGRFETEAVVDRQAKKLFENDISKYLKQQMKKISENMLNRKVAEELLRHKEQRQATVKQL